MNTRRVIPIRAAEIADEAEQDNELDARITRLTLLAGEVFRRRDKAERWLRRPLRELGGVSPLDMMETPAGARQVELILLQYADQ